MKLSVLFKNGAGEMNTTNNASNEFVPAVYDSDFFFSQPDLHVLE